MTQKQTKRGDSSPRFLFDKSKQRKHLLKWFGKNPAAHPWRLDFQRTQDPYVIWVSEIMLQQTVIKAVLPVYARFIRSFPTLGHLARASEDDVRTAVRGLGYYRRFSFLHKAAKELAGPQGRKKVAWPSDFEGWKQLPGVGDYTAAAVSSIAFNYPAAAVDGNVDRIIVRLLGIREPVIPGPTKKMIHAAAEELLDTKNPGRFNEAMMELGQTVCRPLNPRCDACVFADGCVAKQQNLTALIPAPKPPQIFEDVQLNLYILRNQNKVWLGERPKAARFLKGTKGFTTEIATNGQPIVDGESKPFASKRQIPKPVGAIKHGITKHKITAQVILMDLKSKAPLSSGQWIDANDIEPMLVSNLDRKAWRLAQKKWNEI